MSPADLGLIFIFEGMERDRRRRCGNWTFCSPASPPPSPPPPPAPPLPPRGNANSPQINITYLTNHEQICSRVPRRLRHSQVTLSLTGVARPGHAVHAVHTGRIMDKPAPETLMKWPRCITGGDRCRAQMQREGFRNSLTCKEAPPPPHPHPHRAGKRVGGT